MITIEQFAEHLDAAAAAVEGELEAVTVIVTERATERAKGYIGHLQDGWQPLAESTIEGWDAPWGRHLPGKRELGFTPPDYEPLKRKGALEQSITGETDGTTGIVGSPELVALWQEMGTHRNGAEHIPPRPFLALAVQNAVPDIETECGNLAVRLLTPEET